VFQLNGWLADYVVMYDPSSVSETLDYEGLIPNLQTGYDTLVFSDELTARKLTITGSYYKRYL
jgi:hypothetical protein